MSQRRFHSKSRQGCSQCKKARTKCDENKPKCGRCDRIGSDCSLADQASDWTIVQVNHSESTNHQKNNGPLDGSFIPHRSSNGHSSNAFESLIPETTSASSIKHVAARSPFTVIEIEHLMLMHHYALHTSASIADITIPEGRDRSVWSEWVPELAFEHDFLLYGLLSLSALHLALRDISRQKNLVTAIHHHSKGITLFRSHLSSLQSDLRDALFAFSCLTACYSFGIQRSLEPEVDSITKLHQVLTLIRGSSVITKSDFEAHQQSRWSVMMVPISLQSTQKLPDEVEDMLSKLLTYTSRLAAAAGQKDMYFSAIQTLRDTLTIAFQFQRVAIVITLFPVMSPPNFWVLVRIGEPLALAILANYAVILYWLRGNIWMAGWGKETVDAVHQALPPDWHECIAWAIRETKDP